ncbi:hypothetical protein [Marinitenerispora sediminis]|uniref:DNA-binding protein n=1 Tax=Marinitenerispora sediminis TaxID=1931232 RepID=A0A368T9U4_9ACTN|nr:hypothetical protein [Marinitenerispora sediminis]RCV49925.1 hypothetical protein DEF28_19495 [Marinitenerispora sediminis]RCV53950.1 hypothetical protein DEF23_16720 [Marinitenerispora sediminis]RCV61435.1 hypothetical protein DEF24_04355 [Marinitenerispora sediminis]
MTTTGNRPAAAQTEALLDAGLAPLAEPPADTATDEVRARRYTHPALPGRPVVRLAADTLAPAEDAAMRHFGFHEPETSDPLALTRPRGLGYPEWALVHDRGNANAALAAVRPMERAAKLAHARPGAAAEAFGEIAATLPHTHLAAFWEQAGRAFLAGGSPSQASIMFGRAREAERVYSIPVDEATRREAVLEFAFAGALSVKALAGYAADLARGYEPGAAYEQFRELALRRTLGGLPPWAEMPAQLRSLARAAGRDPAAEEARTLRELLEMPATASAPAGFWRKCRASLVALAAGDPAVRGLLLELFPTSETAGFHGWWLELLDDCGALADLADPAAGIPGGAAAWLSRMVGHVRSGREATPARLHELVPRIAGRLAADGVPVRVDGTRGRGAGPVELDLLDLCLAHAVPVAAPREGQRLGLDHWLHGEREAERRDLAAVAADARWSPLLVPAVRSYATSRKADALLGLPVLRPLATAYLDGLVDRLAGGGVGAARQTLEALGMSVSPSVLAGLPGRREALAAADYAQVLARTLRGGILDEYGWDALDEAARELLGTGQQRPELSAVSSWPVLTLCTPARAIAVDGSGRVAEHALRLPAGARKPTAVYTGGQFLVCYTVAGQTHMYWSSDPGTVISEPDSSLSYRWQNPWHRALGAAQLTAEGIRWAGGRALSPGERPDGADRYVLSDGATHWRVAGETGLEIDPVTGEEGRASLPAFLEDLPLRPGERLQLHSSTLAPLPEGGEGSPLGHADGLVGSAVLRGPTDTGGEAAYRIVGVDGRTAELSWSFPRGVVLSPWGVVRYPGGGELGILSGTNVVVLHASDGSGPLWDAHAGAYDDYTGQWGTPFVPDPVFWHHLRPRDTAASAVLRSATREQAARLLETARAEIGDDLSRTDTPITAKAVAELLGGDPHPGVLAGAAGTVVATAREVLRRDRFTRQMAVEPVREVRVNSHELGLALGGMVDKGSWPGHDTVGQIGHTHAFLTGAIDPDTAVDQPKAGLDWTELVGRIGGAAWRTLVPGVSESQRTALRGLLDTWSATCFADPEARLARGRVFVESGGAWYTAAVDPAAPDHRRVDLAVDIPAWDITQRYGRKGFVRRYVEIGSGDLPAPVGRTLVDREEPAFRWGTAAQLRALLDGLDAQGPLEWDLEAAGVLAERAGLSAGAAALLLAGWPKGRGWHADIYGAELRALLGLKTAEAQAAQDEMNGISGADLLDLYSAALPGTPEEIAALWRPGGLRELAERLAAAWVGRFGRRTPLPTETVVAAQALLGADGVHRRLELVRSPDEVGVLTEGGRSWLAVDDDGRVVLQHEGAPLDRVLASLGILLPWCYAELPPADPVRLGAPRALELLRERLADPELLVWAGHVRSGGERRSAFEAAFGPAPYRAPGGAELPEPCYDDGLTVLYAGRGEMRLWFRPALLGDDRRSRLLRAMVADHAWGGCLDSVDLLRRPGYGAMADRISAAGPDGDFDADPAACVPALVAETAAAHGIADDAARLYLQLLAVLEPTDRRVRAWNGWTAARHRKAEEQLVDRGLVVRAKRSRAGRSLFLPGGWVTAKSPNLPFETWKLPLYDLRTGNAGQPTGPLSRFLPLRPYPELFTAAAERVARGDGPE